MPASIIDDDTQVFVMLVKSFEILKKFLAVNLWAELCCDVIDSQCSKDVDFLELVEDIFHAWSGSLHVPCLNEMWFEFERCFVQK